MMMGNVKKLYLVLLPILLMPLLGSLAQTLLTWMGNALLGAFYLAADSLTQTLYSVAGLALYPVAMLGVAIPAIRMEEGKEEAAKAAHRWALMIYGALIAAAAAVFLLLGPALLRLVSSTAELIDVGSTSLRAGAVSMLGTALIAGAIGQMRPAYSLRYTLTFGVMMILVWAVAGYVIVIRGGICGLGLSRGGIFAATRIAPFLMIPVKSYAPGFRLAQREE